MRSFTYWFFWLTNLLCSVSLARNYCCWVPECVPWWPSTPHRYCPWELVYQFWIAFADRDTFISTFPFLRATVHQDRFWCHSGNRRDCFDSFLTDFHKYYNNVSIITFDKNYAQGQQEEHQVANHKCQIDPSCTLSAGCHKFCHICRHCSSRFHYTLY